MRTAKHSWAKEGFHELRGLSKAMTDVLKPLSEHLESALYWKDAPAFEPSEYKARDGFMPFSSNHGGLECVAVIPSCERYDWDFLEFGECDECGSAELGLNRYGSPKQCGYNGDECSAESEGHLDAKLRIWFKFEGVNDKGEMEFYLYMGGGNGDAPYFRNEPTIFEASFKARTLRELRERAKKHVAKLMKVMGAK